MAQHATLPPQTRGRWFPMTWDEFLAWSPDEGHVAILVFLIELLGRYVRILELGRLFVDGMLLRLPERPSGRMPDLFVVATSDLDRVQHQWVDGPALLAVEIVSEDSVGRDTNEKRT